MKKRKKKVRRVEPDKSGAQDRATSCDFQIRFLVSLALSTSHLQPHLDWTSRALLALDAPMMGH